MEDIKLDNLIINKLTKAQYDSAEKSENELYAITDEEFYTKSEVEQFVKENINCFTITEDMVTVEKDATKGTAPYSTAYGYTNITINDNSIVWKEGAIYVFVVNTAMAVNSAYRNVRVRIGVGGDWKPMMDTNSIMSGSSYMVKGMNTNFQYKTVYQSTGALHRQTDTNTTYTLNTLMNQSIYVSGTGSYAISRYSICMQKPDLTWEKLTDTSQGYSQATTKTVNTSGFLLNLRYYNTTADLGNGSKTAVNTMCSQYYDVHLNYSTNCGTKHNQQTGTPVFIVGSIGEDGLFYLDTEQWWSYALPTTNDGKLYIYIGTTINTTDSRISFEVYKPIYYHNGTKICEYKISDNKQDVITDIETIREGASKGATALQSVPSEYITETELNAKGYLTSYTETDPIYTADKHNIAKTDLSNLSEVGEKHFLNKSQITNCLLEVPQHIKYTLVDGTLTIKAGSVVIVPYGTEDLTAQYPVGVTFIRDWFKVYDTQFADGKFFVWAELTEDKVLPITSSSIAYTKAPVSFNFSANTESSVFGWSDKQDSGTETGTVASTLYYQTDNNTYLWQNTGTEYMSLPILQISHTANSGIVTIDQTFNGIGYIGSIYWIDKGVTSICGKGKNIDGSINNAVRTTEKIELVDITDWDALPNACSGYLINVYCKESNTNAHVFQPYSRFLSSLQTGLSAIWYYAYIEHEQQWYFYNGEGDPVWRKAEIYIYANMTTKGGNLTPKQAFRAADAQDYVQKSGDTMTGDLYIEKDYNPILYIKNTSQEREIAPSESAGTQYLCLVDKNNNVMGRLGLERYTNGRQTVKLQVFSADGKSAPAMRVNVYADNTIGCEFPRCTTKATTTSSARNDLVAVVVQNYVSGTSWYRVWSDGWIEQGGVSNVNGTTKTTIKLLKAFSNTNYTVTYANGYDNVPSGTHITNVGTKKTNSFIRYGSSAWTTFNWYACGY